jgi:hypothetical protein
VIVHSVDPAPFAALAPAALCDALDAELARRAVTERFTLNVRVEPTALHARVTFDVGAQRQPHSLDLAADDARVSALVAWARARGAWVYVALALAEWDARVVQLSPRAARVVALFGAPAGVLFVRGELYTERGEPPAGCPGVGLSYGDDLWILLVTERTHQDDHQATQARMDAAARELGRALDRPVASRA